MIQKIKSKLRNPIRKRLLYLYNLHRFSFLNRNKRTTLIICFDGFSQHGGLVDRLKGIISFYEISKKIDADFKIYHPDPYFLQTFVEPNLIDWIATEEDMKWNFFNAEFLYLMLEFGFEPLKFFNNKKLCKKYFIYCNIDFVSKLFPNSSENEQKKIWSASFQELFKKSELLQKTLTNLQLPTQRIAIHSRFTSILGDFVDTITNVLPEEEQKKLFLNLKLAIEQQTSDKNPTQVFIFSDSIKYLNFIKQNTLFSVLEGEPKHPDNKAESISIEEHLKTFIDFFVIAESEKILLVRTSYMYPSAFSKYASYINNIPFKTIEI